MKIVLYRIGNTTPAQYEIATTADYYAPSVKVTPRGNRKLIVKSAWSSDFVPQSGPRSKSLKAAFNVYREIERSVGKRFDHSTAQIVIDMIDHYSHQWQTERQQQARLG